jgi:hypothetical protein
MGTISRVKSWNTNETLTASDLNAEFTNIINNINSNNLDNTNLDTSATYQFDSVIVGHSALVTTSAAYKLQGLGTGAVDSGMALGRFSADANGPTVSFLKSRHGTIGSNTIVQDNDILGTIEFMAADGSTLDTPGASIFARVNGTPGANDLPTELVFATTADGANSVTERMRISTAGLVSVVGDMSVGDDLLLASDSAVLSLGDGADATLTHDGTTGVTIAANPITVDSGGNLTLDAHTGILIIKDAGSEVLRFTEGNSGDVTVKLATNGKDLVFTDNGDATNMKILDAAAGINVPGEVQTTKIAYTDGDDAITIADGGGVTTSGTLTIGTVAAAGSDTDKFLVLDASGNVDYRTGTQVLSDIGGAGSGSGTAADDISDGDAAVSIATTSGNITIDAQANDADVIIKVDDGGSAVTALTLDGSDEGNAIFVNDVQLKSDGALLEFGADLDTTLTHTDGTGLTLNSTNKLTFGDAASFVQQSGDGTLRIDGEAIIDLNASTRVDVSGDLKVGGEVQTASIGYTDGDNAITIADGGGVTTAGTLATTGAATLASLVCTAAGTFGGGYGSTGATISDAGVGQFNGALTTDGELAAASLDISGAVDIAGDLTLSAGADGALRFSVASSVKMLDNSATSLVIEEADNAYMTFVTTNGSEAIKFDKALDINAAMQIDNTVTVGVNGTGYDVQLFGDTAGSSVLWDQSADDLILTNAGLAVGSDATGDVYYRDASGFLARLGVGSDGQVLTSTGTLPNWEALPSSGVALATNTDNQIATVTGSNAITGESNLLFTGSALTVTGTATVTSTITAGGVVDVTAGSASAPAICKTGDTNTGVLFPAADTVAITTAGTERIRVDSSGRMTNPSQPFFYRTCSELLDYTGNGDWLGLRF